MEALLEPIQDVLEGQIDFEGQRMADFLSTTLLVVTSALAFILGYISKDIYLTMWIGLGGLFLTMLVVVPPWPAFNEHPEPWLRSEKDVAGLVPGGIIVEQKTK